MNTYEKMREAVQDLVSYWDSGVYHIGREMELNAKIRSVLAEPRRNCDKFGTDNAEASLAYEEFCDRAEVDESINGAIAWLLSLDAD